MIHCDRWVLRVGLAFVRAVYIQKYWLLTRHTRSSIIVFRFNLHCQRANSFEFEIVYNSPLHLENHFEWMNVNLSVNNLHNNQGKSFRSFFFLFHLIFPGIKFLFVKTLANFETSKRLENIRCPVPIERRFIFDCTFHK